MEHWLTSNNGNETTYTVESAISVNLPASNVVDNTEETVMSGSVETIRTRPAMVKI